MSWKDLRIWVKIMLVFGTCFFIYIGITLWNNVVLNKIEADKEIKLGDQQLLHSSLSDLEKQYSNLLLNTLDFHLKEDIISLVSDINQFTNSVSKSSKNTTFEDARLSAVYSLKVREIEQILVALSSNVNNIQADFDAGLLQTSASLKSIKEKLLQLDSECKLHIEEEFAILNNAKLSQKKNIIIVQSSAILIFIALFLILLISLNNAKRATIRIAMQLARGNLAVDFGRINKDDFGQITKSMFELRNRIRDTVVKINETIISVEKARSELN